MLKIVTSGKKLGFKGLIDGATKNQRLYMVHDSSHA